MSSTAILDNTGFCALLCAFNISCAEKIIILKQNKHLCHGRCLLSFIWQSLSWEGEIALLRVNGHKTILVIFSLL